MNDQSVTGLNPTAGNIIKHRKEKHYDGGMALIDCTTKSVVVDLRFYATEAVTYCCVWLFLPTPITNANGLAQTNARGGAKASGWGYHRRSAAMMFALEDAGLAFAQPFDGVGDSAMRSAFEAIAAYLGLDNYMIHYAHA